MEITFEDISNSLLKEKLLAFGYKLPGPITFSTRNVYITKLKKFINKKGDSFNEKKKNNRLVSIK